MDIAPETIVDRYTIESLLGEGGMAVVYKARHNRLGTAHAIKVLKVPHTAIQERLLQEGRVQAQLNHPNIVAVTDVIDVEGAPGLVMEHIAGADLEERLATERLTLEQADVLVRGILEGVAAAHALDLIHRDLKPGNILLAVDPARPGSLIPKITDFGLAKLLDPDPGSALSKATRSGVAMGTPAYMAPEQIKSARDVDARADVFSLGAILYEMVTGVQCFSGDSILEIFNAIDSGEREPVATLAPELPERMAAAIEGALATDPDLRIPDVATLLRTWTGETEAPVGPFTDDAASPAPVAALPDSFDTIDAGSALDTMALPPPPSSTRAPWAVALVLALSAGVVLTGLITAVVGASLWANRGADTEAAHGSVPDERTASPGPSATRRTDDKPSPSPSPVPDSRQPRTEPTPRVRPPTPPTPVDRPEAPPDAYRKPGKGRGKAKGRGKR